MDNWEKEHREDIGTEEQDLGHHTSESARIAHGVDPVEGFEIEEPTADQLDADDGYVDEPPDVAAEDLVPSAELDDEEPLE